MPMLKFFDTVCKTAVVYLISINFIQKQSHDVQLKFLHHHIKFHLDQMKSMRENEANRFCLVLTL